MDICAKHNSVCRWSFVIRLFLIQRIKPNIAIMEKENNTIDLERLAELSGFVNRDIGLHTSVNVSPDNNNVDHPKHYNSHPSGIECITIARHHNFNIGNAIKYLWRAGLKHEQGMEDKDKQIEDLQKAIFYIKDEIRRISINEADGNT